MTQKVRCKKCGRVLKSAISIARGMGPECAGISPSKGRIVRISVRRSLGKGYQSSGAGSSQMPLIPTEAPTTKKGSRWERARKRREERRRLFETRQPFLVSSKRTPLGYEPSGESEWKETASGRLISHERLQAYLKRYQFI